LPQGTRDGQLVIQNYLGQELKRLNLAKEDGIISLDITELSAGSYFYVLVSNEKELNRKKFVVID